MKSAKDIFAAAQHDGTRIEGADASVVRADSPMRLRLWLGYQAERLAVAYFETDDTQDVSFSVSRVISIESVDVDDEATRSRARALRVVCHEPRLNNVFYVFIDEVRAEVEGGGRVLEVIQSAAGDWRRLLQIANVELSESGAAGIYGELRFLEAAVVACGPSVLKSWQRSAQDSHDFSGEGSRVEVKTSAFQNRSAVTIHGLRQLEAPATGTLTLAVAEVQKHGGETIDDVVARLVGKGVDSSMLTRKLSEAGYVEGMPGSEEFTFSLRSWRFWEIDEDSPVLNRSSLDEVTADAVFSLSYSLNLGSLGEGADTFDFSRLESKGVSQA